MDWKPIATAPFDRVLELAVVGSDGPHALVFPCLRILCGWISAETKKPVEVRPTHWRAWRERSGPDVFAGHAVGFNVAPLATKQTNGPARHVLFKMHCLITHSLRITLQSIQSTMPRGRWGESMRTFGCSELKGYRPKSECRCLPVRCVKRIVARSSHRGDCNLRCKILGGLFNQPVGECEHLVWDGKAERLGRFQID